MKRGDIHTAAGSGLVSKPRPVVIVQSSVTLALRDSVTVCLVSSDLIDAPSFRVRVQPSASNGFRAVSDIMADKLMTLPKSALGKRIGGLTVADLARLDEAIRFWLGLA
jgi:mRNA interferase MazF